MSSEVVVRVRCDNCSVVADTDVPVSQNLSLVYNKRTAEIDLCDTCRKEMEMAVIGWMNKGRKPERSVTPSVPRKAGRGGNSPDLAYPVIPDDVDTSICFAPDCGYGPFTNREATRKHLQVYHQIGMREAYAKWGTAHQAANRKLTPDDSLACLVEGCDQVFKGAQGRAVHMGRIHGIHPDKTGHRTPAKAAAR